MNVTLSFMVEFWFVWLDGLGGLVVYLVWVWLVLLRALCSWLFRWFVLGMLVSDGACC